MHRSAARPGARIPLSSPWTRAVLPVARHRIVSAATPPSEARWAIRRRMPRGITPVPDGASLPRMTRSSAPDSAARRSATSAVRPFPQCTSSRAIPDSDSISRSMSRSGREVVPPLTWPAISGAASRTASAPIAPEPGRDGPPVWKVDVIPNERAQATIGAASAPVLTDPNPISPMRLTPAAAISAKSACTMPSSRIGAPAWTLTPPGRTFA